MTISNQEPMRSYLLSRHPPKFAVGDFVRVKRGSDTFAGTITEFEWIDGGWIYKVDDGSNLVGGTQFCAEDFIEGASAHEKT